ncbi:MAG: hypothetical protein LBJ63_02900 [Prevotellaceae bacterium]|jgi:hypothetical protein|nr:hypothetical protein [Prevotellaceae bacterium]
MSTTIKGVLDNAEYNLTENHNLSLGKAIGTEQLRNANKLLNAGYKLYDDFDESWEELEKENEEAINN